MTASTPGKPAAEVETTEVVQVNLEPGRLVVQDAEARSDGTVLLVWCSQETVPYTSCRAQAVDPSGRPRGDGTALLQGLALCGEVDVARPDPGTLAVVGTCVIPNRVSNRTTWVEIHGEGGVVSGPFQAGNPDRDHSSPRIVPSSSGGWWVVWAERADAEAAHTLHAREIDGQGEPAGEPFPVSPPGDSPGLHHAAVGLPDGFAVAWAAQDPAGDSVIRLRRFSHGGKPLGDPVDIVLPPSQTASGLDLASDGAGRITSVWRANDPRGGGPARLMAVTSLPLGEPLSGPVALTEGETTVLGNPSLAARDDRQAIAWFETGRDGASDVLKLQAWSPEHGPVGDSSTFAAETASHWPFLRALPLEGEAEFSVLWRPGATGPGDESGVLHWIRADPFASAPETPTGESRSRP